MIDFFKHFRNKFSLKVFESLHFQAEGSLIKSYFIEFSFLFIIFIISFKLVVVGKSLGMDSLY